MILIAILTGLFIGVLLIYLLAFQIGVKSSSANNTSLPPVSIILALRNEADNLNNYLPSIVDQDYPNFGIILVNDHSSDNTLAVAKVYEAQHECVKLIENNGKGKKSAIKTGIYQAKNEILLFTDADCEPNTHYWIREMMRCFKNDISIVLGYSPYRFKKRMSNFLLQYETLLTACLYISAAHLDEPYMGVGRNLAYRKSLFLKSDQFESHLDLLSGDDDLFVQKMGTASNTAVCLSPRAFVQSKPVNSLYAFFKQKRRHISTVDNYQKKHKIILGLFFSVRLGILLGFLLLISLSSYTIQALIGLLVYFILLQIAYILPCRKLAVQKINWYVPILELILVSFQLVLGFDKLINKKKINWK